MNYLVGEKKAEKEIVGLSEIGEGLFEISVDGATVRVDIVKSGPTVFSLIEEGRQWEAAVDERDAHGFDVLVSGRLFHLEAEDERSGRLAQSAKVSASGPQTVEAEMPGKVSKVEVGPGGGASGSDAEVVIVPGAMHPAWVMSPTGCRETTLPLRTSYTTPGPTVTAWPDQSSRALPVTIRSCTSTGAAHVPGSTGAQSDPSTKPSSSSSYSRVNASAYSMLSSSTSPFGGRPHTGHSPPA